MNNYYNIDFSRSSFSGIPPFTNSNMYNLKWKIYDIKRTPVKKKIISRQKWLRKMHLKNVVITYKSQILMFKIQQKVFYKKDVE